MRVAIPQGDLTEKQFQQQVVDIAKACGWKKAYHTFDSRRSHPGFPDLVLVRERVVFVELKSQTGQLSETQRQWVQALVGADAEVYVWRPSDLDDVAAVLSRRERRAP